MVTISSYEKRQRRDGTSFFVLILQGEVEIVFSPKTGLPYANVAKCSMPAPFDEATCKNMVGTKIPGSIIKEDCEPYDYTNPRTKEVTTLDYNYAYSPMENNSAEKAVFQEA